MKVCYLSSVLSVHDYRFLFTLVERNFETWLVTYNDGEIPDYIRGIKNLKIIHRRPRYFRGIQKFLFAAKRRDFRKVLKEIRPDVIHSGFVWKDGFLAALSGFHPHFLMVWGSDILVHPQKSRICRHIVRYTVKRADMIGCDCREVKKRTIELTGYPEDKFVVFPCGIDLTLFNTGKDGFEIRKKLGWEKNKILISNRFFHPVYKIDQLIEALPEVFSAEPSARVILAGAGPEENKLRGRVKARGLEDLVYFAGAVPNPEMPHYLNAADIYVSFSRSDGTSLCLLEAFACGLPVVVSDVPANLEWVKDGINGCVVSRGSIKQLSEKILLLLKDLDLREKMREKNLIIAEKEADWEKNFDKLQEAYTRLVFQEGRVAEASMC